MLSCQHMAKQRSRGKDLNFDTRHGVHTRVPRTFHSSWSYVSWSGDVARTFRELVRFYYHYFTPLIMTRIVDPRTTFTFARCKEHKSQILCHCRRTTRWAFSLIIWFSSGVDTETFYFTNCSVSTSMSFLLDSLWAHKHVHVLLRVCKESLIFSVSLDNFRYVGGGGFWQTCPPCERKVCQDCKAANIFQVTERKGM